MSDNALVGTARAVGRSVPRVEDPRLLTGRGRFVDDEPVPAALHAAFVRSPVARGRLAGIDTAAARALPGVRAVLTGTELGAGTGALWSTLVGPPAPERLQPPATPLAVDEVRYVGDPVAIVLAESRYVAEDAADLVDVDIEAEPPVLGVDVSLAAGAPLVHPDLGTNVASTVHMGDPAALASVLAAAPVVVRRVVDQPRATQAPMEPRGLAAQWDPASRSLRVWTSSQNPHEVAAFCARLLDVPRSRVHASVGDVGGGFGQKVYVSRDEAAVVLAAHALGGAVKWIEDRQENLIAAAQARADRVAVELALDRDGRLLGARVEHLEDLGAYPMGGAATVGRLVGMLFPGPYRLPAYAFSNRAVFTNTVGRAPYRGPWVAETTARELVLDDAARAVGLDPVELRRRNIVRDDDLPYAGPGGARFEPGDVSFLQTLEQAAERIDLDAVRRRQPAARAAGRPVGIGFSLYVEPSAAAFGPLSTDQATVRIDPAGTVVVLVGTGSSGNSVETTVAQVVADHLAVPVEDISVVQGDSAATPFGPGTVGSRTAPIVGAATHLAAGQAADRVRQIAAHLLEADPADIVLAGGAAHVAGTPALAVPLAEVAAVAYFRTAELPSGCEPGIEFHARFRPDRTYTWSNACHACVCEVDVATGVVRLDRFVVSEDCGVLINPMVVDGQIAGGVAQGIGGALYEAMPYDEAGNPLAATYLDYLVPTATEVPPVEVAHVVTPSALPGGHKGMGEGGAIGAPAAVINAVADALAPLGAVLDELPLSPAVVRWAIRRAADHANRPTAHEL